MRSTLTLLITLVGLGGCTMAPTSQSVSMAKDDLAPSGKLRVAINFGNPILATKNAVTGEPQGLSVDLARELARRLSVPVELVTYTAAGKVVAGIKGKEWDVGFFAIDPERAGDIAFTGPYVVIEGAYLVRQDSPIKTNGDVDREGVRVVVGKGSAYDLYLSRQIKNAQIVRAATSPTVTDMMVAQSLEVAAGVKQQLEADAKRYPGLHLLDGRFMVINQAMATPKDRISGSHYLTKFVEEMKASGFVANSLARDGIKGASIAPPTP